MIYAFLNQKGGVGKSTLSVTVAQELENRGRRVLLVDADTQGSVMAWSATRPEPTFPVIGMPKNTLHKEIGALAENYDDVVIDGPPRLTELARSITMAAAVIIVPVQPSQYDIWATSETLDLLTEAKIYKPGLIVAIAINRKIANTAIGRDVREALNALPFLTMKADITQRVAFPESVAAGSTVLDGRDRQAAQEIVAFVDELERLHDQEGSDASAATGPNNAGRRQVG